MFAFFDRGESQAQSFSTSCEKCPKGRGLCGEDMMSCSGSKHGIFLGSPSDSSSRIIMLLEGTFLNLLQRAICQVSGVLGAQAADHKSAVTSSQQSHRPCSHI